MAGTDPVSFYFDAQGRLLSLQGADVAAVKRRGGATQFRERTILYRMGKVYQIIFT
jgi:hypothetical protein